jgi:hypothetical protein
MDTNRHGWKTEIELSWQFRTDRLTVKQTEQTESRILRREFVLIRVR